MVAFAGLLALSEGPAEVACVAALLSTAIAGGLAGWRPRPIEIGILVWVFAGIPGMLMVDVPRSSEDMTRPLLALAFVVGARGVPLLDDRWLKRAAWAFAGLIVVNGSFGYVQMHFGALPLDNLILKNPVSPQIMVPGKWGTRAASGLFYNRLKLAHMGIVGLALIALVLTSARPRVRRGTLIGGLLAGLVLGGAIVFSYARMSLIALVAAAAVTALLMSRARVAAAVGLVGAALVGVVAVVAFGAERVPTAMLDIDGRLKMLNLGWTIFADHPLLGVGHGGYRGVAQGYAGSGWAAVRLTSPHNLLMQVLDETGAIGFAGFTAALGAALYTVGRRIREGRGAQGPRVVMERVALFGLVAVLVLGGAHFPLHHAPVALLFWTLMGIASSSARRVSRPYDTATAG